MKTHLTNHHIDQFRLHTSQELSAKADPFEIHINPAVYFKLLTSYHLHNKENSVRTQTSIQVYMSKLQHYPVRHGIYPAADEMPVFVAVDLLIVLEHTLPGARTHEVVITLTRSQTAAHGGARLIAAFTSLLRWERMWRK